MELRQLQYVLQIAAEKTSLVQRTSCILPSPRSASSFPNWKKSSA